MLTMPQAGLSVSVIMPTFNKADYLDLTLASFAAQSLREFEVVVVDDGSSDDTAACVRRYEKDIKLRYIYQPNGGRGSARNRALREARGDLLVFCDDDRLVPRDFLKAHADAAARTQNQVLIGWKKRVLSLWIPDQLPLERAELEALAQRVPRWHAPERCQWITPEDIRHGLLNQALALYGLGDEHDNYTETVYSHGDVLGSFALPWMMGTTANLSVHRKHVCDASLFDENYTGWGLEDTDFCYGLHRKGLGFALSREAVNYHQVHPLEATSLQSGVERRMRDAERNLLHFCSKHDTVESYLFWRTREGLEVGGAHHLLQAVHADERNVLADELRWAYKEILRLRTVSPVFGPVLSLSGHRLDLSGNRLPGKLAADLEPSQPQPGPQTIRSDGRSVAAQARVAPGFSQLLTTNKWWTPLLWQADEAVLCENMFAHPLCLQAHPLGLGIGYPNHASISPDQRMYEYAFTQDLRVQADALELESTGPQVLGYGDWTVQTRWSDASRYLEATAGRGLPYVYFRSAGLTGIAVHFERSPQVLHDGGHHVLVKVNGRYFGLFGSAGSLWEWQGGQVALTSLPHHGYFSIAALPDGQDETFKLFARHSMAFVTGSHTRWHYDRASSTVTTHFELNTEAMEGQECRALQALCRHQWLYADAEFTALDYASPRGAMKLMVGSRFSTCLPYQGVLPYLPASTGQDKSALWILVDSVLSGGDGGIWPQPLEGGSEDDAYWSGKALLRLAGLVQAAEAAGHPGASERFLDEMSQRLDCYFDDSQEPGFYYREDWQTTLFAPAAEHGLCSSMNDHVYTYGYFLRAVALLVRRDPGWLDEPRRKGMVQSLYLDVSNPDRGNTSFPHLRCFDIYAGHSWGSGTAASKAGLNGEPSSEAIHYATALIDLGSAIGDDNMAELGVFLYAHETVAALQYWFDVDRAVFPPGYIHPCAGIVWGAGASCQTWWTAEPEETVGINLLPVQSGSLYLASRTREMRAIADYAVRAGHGLARCWPDIHWMHLAIHDPQAALQAFAAQPDYAPEWGSSRAQTSMWLHSLAALGTVETGVTADIPTYGVFRRGAERIHVAYNSEQHEQIVRFSDGVSVSVPARQMRAVSTPVI